MKHFFIIANAAKDKNLVLSKKLKAYIEEKGGTCSIKERNATEGEINRIHAKELPEKVDCILVLGGDGTLIRAARDMDNRNIPLIGVNLGTLGYLCELEETNVFEAIDRIFKEEYVIEERMMLSGCVSLQEKEFPAHSALNDIVIYRAGKLQVVSLKLYVNGKFLYNYFSDGLIISTPTGSTAYSMSAGGPIVDPKAELILITPINAQAMTAKSIVISSHEELVVEVMPRNGRTDEECAEVAFDGDNIAKLKPGEKITIQKAVESTRVLKLSQTSFLETLRKKMDNYK